MRFFADHCISNFVIRELRSQGHQVFRLREHIPQNSPDPIVLDKAQEFDSILISLNGDFSDIVTYPPSQYKGIVALQLHNRPRVEPHVINLLRQYLHTHLDQKHYKGKLFLVEPHRIRIRG